MTTLPPEEPRTLLENAAKACGYELVRFHLARQDPFARLDTTWAGDWAEVNKPSASLGSCRWQPHLPGLDSQVLAAELGINTDWGIATVFCDTFETTCVNEIYANHPFKAHAQAMAVLRVAAEIGEAT